MSLSIVGSHRQVNGNCVLAPKISIAQRESSAINLVIRLIAIIEQTMIRLIMRDEI
jgi:hypothetical protein